MDDLPSEDDREIERHPSRKTKREARSFPVFFFFFFHSSPFNGFPCTPFSSDIRVVPRDEPFSKNALSSIVGDSFRQAYAKWKLLHISRPTFVFQPTQTRALLRALPHLDLSRISDATMRDGGQKIRRVESGSRPIIRKISPLS